MRRGWRPGKRRQRAERQAAGPAHAEELTAAPLHACCPPARLPQEGLWLAPRLREAFPWLRLVISMRDPISQALSMHLHNLSHNRS